MKYLVIPLMFFYALAVSGITVHAHYCGKHLVSWALYAKGNDCGSCEKEKKKNCCKDKVVSLKVSQEQKNVTPFQSENSVTDLVLPKTFFISYNAKFLLTYRSINHFTNAPPGLWQSIPLYKLNSSFTYYG
jgi:hypothetical protein